MKYLACCVSMIATACTSATSFSTSSLGASSSSASSDTGDVTIPDVFKLEKDAAIAALRRAGVQADIREENSLCGSTVDGTLIELDEVCYQFPPAGRVQSARFVVTIRVQTEDPRHGNVGKNTEWRLMPDLVGKTYEQALAEMRRNGFLQDDLLQQTSADETSCKPRVVCRQYPAPMERVGITSRKVIYVGQDPNAPKDPPAKRNEAAQRDSNPSESAERQPPHVEPAKTGAPKEDEALPPLFGAP